MSYVDLLSMPYAQQVAPGATLDNSILRNAVGSNASLLDQSKTLEMYRANVKKTNDPPVQYEFAVFMVQTAMELPPDGKGPNSREEMLKEARHILHKLADRSYPFAQYYLGDGFSSGLFNKGKEDYDRAFPLFSAASKHGHAEAGYRAGLCYEFGWGCRKDYAKAAQFYRASASKNHPGAATRLGMACLEGTMGLTNHYREGIKWLKRAAESADFQYNAAPYELGRLHENGYGDDIFKDEVYAAQLFTQSADLGHPEANLVMGKAYEYGMLKCPKDAALSIHFYNGAAQAGLPEAMMSLCAWYLFGAEPILAKDENEAYEWANRAAEQGKSLKRTNRAEIKDYVLTWWDVQATPKPSTRSATSRRSVSAAARTRSKPTSGTCAPHSRARNGPSSDWPSSRTRRRAAAAMERVHTGVRSQRRKRVCLANWA
jgi:TPR repeat protein